MSDEATFTHMFQEHYEAVLRYAWRRAGPADAADVASETFKIAWEKYARFPHDHPLPWLYATARNLTQNLIRKDKRRNALTEQLAHQNPADDHANVLARQAALTALNSLSDNDKELVLLISWEGLNVSQAARTLGCSTPAATMRLHRIRKRLSHLLADHPDPKSPMAILEPLR